MNGIGQILEELALSTTTTAFRCCRGISPRIRNCSPGSPNTHFARKWKRLEDASERHRGLRVDSYSRTRPPLNPETTPKVGGPGASPSARGRFLWDISNCLTCIGSTAPKNRRDCQAAVRPPGPLRTIKTHAPATAIVGPSDEKAS